METVKYEVEGFARQRQRVSVGHEDPAGRGLTGGGFGNGERQTGRVTFAIGHAPVHGAKGAPVVRAAVGNTEKDAFGFGWRPVHGMTGCGHGLRPPVGVEKKSVT